MDESSSDLYNPAWKVVRLDSSLEHIFKFCTKQRRRVFLQAESEETPVGTLSVHRQNIKGKPERDGSEASCFATFVKSFMQKTAGNGLANRRKKDFGRSSIRCVRCV